LKKLKLVTVAKWFIDRFHQFTNWVLTILKTDRFQFFNGWGERQKVGEEKQVLVYFNLLMREKRGERDRQRCEGMKVGEED
jgi:hypothetical protein